MTATSPLEGLPPPPPPGWEVPTAPRRWTRLGAVTGAAVVAGGCLYLALVDPNTSSAYPPCPLKALTGLDCAGCGGLRATHALLTGDPVRAADHNLLAVALLPVLAYLVLRWVLGRTGRELPALRWHPAMTFIAVAVVVAYSVVRNLPWGPGPYLYSGAG